MARVFGLFAEDIVRLWTRLPNSPCPYLDLGRPSFYDEHGKYTNQTFDFAFVPKGQSEPKRFWLGELKSWVDYESGRHAMLTQEMAQKHAEDIWACIEGKQAKVKKAAGTEGVPMRCEGVILVWPCSAEITLRDPLKGVVTLERVLRDLNAPGRPDDLKKMLHEFDHACGKLLSGLGSFS